MHGHLKVSLIFSLCNFFLQHTAPLIIIMSNLSFLNFQYGISRKPSLKPAQMSISKERQISSMSKGNNFQANVEEMRWVFNKYDTNKDGKISREEYKSALKVLDKGISETEVAKAFQMIDSDGDGFIDFKEFMEMYNMGGGVKATDIQSAFQVFDLDGNGKISAEELSQVLKKLGEGCSLKACRKMVKGVDTNGDGFIDINEFMTMMAGSKKLS
jgi:calcium-binding protein CML